MHPARASGRHRLTIGLALLVACGGLIASATASSAAATVPSVPRFPTAMPRNGQARVRWIAPARSGGSYVTDSFGVQHLLDAEDWLRW